MQSSSSVFEPSWRPIPLWTSQMQNTSSGLDDLDMALLDVLESLDPLEDTLVRLSDRFAEPSLDQYAHQRRQSQPYHELTFHTERPDHGLRLTERATLKEMDVPPPFVMQPAWCSTSWHGHNWQPAGGLRSAPPVFRESSAVFKAHEDAYNAQVISRLSSGSLRSDAVFSFLQCPRGGPSIDRTSDPSSLGTDHSSTSEAVASWSSHNPVSVSKRTPPALCHQQPCAPTTPAAGPEPALVWAAWTGSETRSPIKLQKTPGPLCGVTHASSYHGSSETLCDHQHHHSPACCAQVRMPTSSVATDHDGFGQHQQQLQAASAWDSHPTQQPQTPTAAVPTPSSGMRATKRGKRKRCHNCGIYRTPQWRSGPAGPHTLCNACGTRYKKGLPLEDRVRVWSTGRGIRKPDVGRDNTTP